MASLLEEIADALARDALRVSEETKDENLIRVIAQLIGESSTTTQEAFMTFVRVRRSERRARELLAERIGASWPLDVLDAPGAVAAPVVPQAASAAHPATLPPKPSAPPVQPPRPAGIEGASRPAGFAEPSVPPVRPSSALAAPITGALPEPVAPRAAAPAEPPRPVPATPGHKGTPGHVAARPPAPEPAAVAAPLPKPEPTNTAPVEEISPLLRRHPLSGAAKPAQAPPAQEQARPTTAAAVPPVAAPTPADPAQALAAALARAASMPRPAAPSAAPRTPAPPMDIEMPDGDWG
ncbi:hypothetical protein [Rubellimicrobium roseum]|uniref:Uncharacterized protein n=1 Tax=Rubellimicrobium roseum TaxID=687525 RepID=A0A5C4NDC4_9RHOB|nr:hypothetical protein [Rubellimicrobium roseum]TNC67562.1 hypothetical protein FHG71_15290 [Rubellimicrobium roseum]